MDSVKRTYIVKVVEDMIRSERLAKERVRPSIYDAHTARISSFLHALTILLGEKESDAIYADARREVDRDA